MKKKSLAETHPEVSKQWHPTNNGELTPSDVTSGSGKKIWWKCDKGDDHEWQYWVRDRTKGDGCPICSGRKIVPSNCLATLNPQLSKQWHPTKNKELTPFNIGKSSNKKVWWKCEEGDDHEWETSVNNRKGGLNGCPICSGRKIVPSNCLATLNPQLSKQWHPTKNGDLKPYDVGLGSDKKVWWKCDKGDDHEWMYGITHMARGNGCPICSGQKIVPSNCLATLNPKLSKQWHPTKNGDLKPYDIGLGYGKKVWWKCNKGDDHEWFISPFARKKSNCPVCRNLKVVHSNCLVTTNKEIADQWHPTLNGNLTPLEVTSGSEIKVWWKCDKGDDHEWKALINARSRGNGCPICSGQKIVPSNCLATLNPKLSKQWHPTKNGDLKPYDVGLGSNTKVWWKCDKRDDHEWKVNINSRVYFKSSCPFCNLTPQSKQELIITFELMKLFKNIDPKGLKTKLEGKLRAIDIYIPKLNLCVEFDGSYWHKDKRDIDKIKSEMLFEEGFKLIRVREEPLKKIYNTDVISKKPYNGKQVTNDILSMILSIFELDPKLVSKIKDYQSKDGLQNEKGLEKYIDKILTEKADKK